jgi:PAS domain S-box-containing protein
MPTQTDADALQRSYRRLVGATGLAIIAVLAVLIWREFEQVTLRDLELRGTALRERIVAVEAIAAAADVHVAALRAAVSRDLETGAAGLPDPELPLYDPAATEPVAFLPAPAPEVAHRSGVLFGIPAAIERRAEARAEIRTLVSLFPMAAAAHAAQPFFRWSYFFSEGRDLIAIYPFAELESFLGAENRGAAMAGYYDYDVYKLTTPERNLTREPTWTPVYVDAGGAGLMVSHNAPVDVGGRQRGMVGTDVLLAALSDRLAAPGSPEALIVIADQAGSVVADSRRAAPSAGTILRAADLLPAAVEAIPAGRFARVGEHYLRSGTIAGTPWTVYEAVPVEAVRAAATRQVTPYLLFLVLLTGALAAAFALIGRRFVQPAFGLVSTIEMRLAGQEADAPAVPAPWQPWIERVLEVFRQREATLARAREAEAKSAAIINVALDAVVTTDADGRVVDFNPAAETIFGLSRGEATGRPIGELIVPEHHRDAHAAGMARHKRTGRSHVLGQRLELEALHASGRVFPVEIQIHQLADLSGVRYAAYLRDLTEQKAAEAAIRDQQEKLYQAEKLTAMGSLLAGLAHELNNPLAVVIAQTSLLEEIAAEGPVRNRASKIRVAAERCGRIVRTFLSMVRKQLPQRTATDLRALVAQSLEVLAYGLKSSGVEVVERHDPNLPPIEADPDQLNQVLINVLVNAQQAFGDRPGARTVWIETSRDAAGQVVLTVSDNGPGIPETALARIFEAFFTTKPVGVGTGIGLAVCRSIVEAHGGRITAENRPEGGATFRITLPARQGAAGAAAPAPESEAATGAAPARTILVVDDEPEVADALSGFLELDGHAVRMVHSIPAALEAMAGGERYAAVFCDLRMPGGGGTALWTEVARRDPALADRFVFVTGDMVAGPETVRNAAAGRPVRILDKPFGREEIRAALADVVGAAEA